MKSSRDDEKKWYENGTGVIFDVLEGRDHSPKDELPKDAM